MTLNLEKVKLEKKGDSRNLSDNIAHAILRWKTKVDLDLYGIYVSKGSPAQKKGFLKKMFSGGDSAGDKQVNYQNRTQMVKESYPFITLDKDAGVGDSVGAGGFNEENMHFWNLKEHDHILIVANIFNKNTNFAQYEGGVTIKCGNEEIDVPLTESRRGSWCTVARIDCTGVAPKLINVNKTQGSKPKVADFV